MFVLSLKTSLVLHFTATTKNWLMPWLKKKKWIKCTKWEVWVISHVLLRTAEYAGTSLSSRREAVAALNSCLLSDAFCRLLEKIGKKSFQFILPYSSDLLLVSLTLYSCWQLRMCRSPQPWTGWRPGIQEVWCFPTLPSGCLPSVSSKLLTSWTQLLLPVQSTY